MDVEQFGSLLGHARRPITNDVVEARKNQIRLLSHGAFGLPSAEALIDRIHLTCSGLTLPT